MKKFNKLKNFLELIFNIDKNISFTIADIGAHPYKQSEEPFHILIDFFPNSKIYAFDIDKQQLENLNKSAKKGIRYFSHALGKKNEKRKFYITENPGCSSLYKPNENLMRLYNNLHFAYLKKEIEIETITLDHFKKEQNIDKFDFIKLDVQGAELDILNGASNSLKDVTFIISEVEFIQLYIDQPLFGDICSYLKSEDIEFHKFLNLSGRSLKPITFNNNLNFSTQHVWSDAIFTKNITQFGKLSCDQLLKLAIFMFIYKSPDLSYFCLNIYDARNKTKTTEILKKVL